MSHQEKLQAFFFFGKIKQKSPLQHQVINKKSRRKESFQEVIVTTREFQLVLQTKIDYGDLFKKPKKI